MGRRDINYSVQFELCRDFTLDYETFAKTWDHHVHDLIKTAAKKTNTIDKKHQQIVDGACRIFFKKGFHPTSIREIADAAGMSMGQLYHYISSKDDVLFLLHKHMQLVWYKCLTENLVEDPDDPVKTMVEAMRLTMKCQTENKKLLRFIYSESKYLSKKHLHVVLQMDKKNVIQFWRDRLAAIKEKIHPDIDIDLAANVIVYLLVFTPLRGWNLKDRPVSEHQEELIRFILNAIGIQ